MNSLITYSWYSQLIKPDWAPPAWIFGPVWGILYTIIAISFGYVLYQAWKGKLPTKALLPFALNLLCNIAFSPLQFGLQSNILAAVDIILVLGTLVWFMTTIWNKYRWVALVNIPYLLWVSFATVLQLTVTYLNW